MNKYQHATSFYNQYVKLKETEKEEFSRLMNKLLSSCFLTLKRDKDRSDFYLILSYLSLYQNYFALMNYELNHYEKDRVLHLVNLENYNHLRLKKLESIVLLTLRKLYYRKMKEISINDNITLSIEQLHDELMCTGLFDKRLNKTELRDIFRVLKKFSIIDIIGDFDKDQSILLLYPTILYAIPYSNIEEIDKRLKSYTKGGISDETVEEDTTH